MASERWEQLEGLFAQAVALTGAGRDAFLARACDGAPELRRELEALLRHADDDRDEGAAGRVVAAAIRSTPAAAPVIGQHELGRLIGQGGMGEVWEAQQLQPVRRRVAIKVIRTGLDSQEVLRRFERERQALALMSHSAIAQVYDAGLTADRRPYFSMEFIDGVAITSYCDTHRLDLRARLELFRQVCAGVQHAHRKTVLHRDLKPSNILVAGEDGRPAPKIIDFGVARATERCLASETLLTEAGLLVGTPDYMSPEQAQGDASDTRSDVYSLGVILYELLAGALPIDPAELRDGGVEAMLRRIRCDVPPRPSAKVEGRGDAGTAVAARRRTSPAALRRQLAGDLDWITMTAIEKDPARRYESAHDLALDLERFLAAQPVVARPPSAAYQLRKFARRHRAGVGAAAGALLLVIGFGAVMAVQADRIAHERDRANIEAGVANEHARFLEDVFRNVDPDRMRGEEVSALDLLNGSAARIESELDDQPELQARLLYSVGRVYRELGMQAEARRTLTRALDVSDRTFGPDDRQSVLAASTLSNVLTSQGYLDAAIPLQQRAIDGLTSARGYDDRSTLRARDSLASTLFQQGRVRASLRLLEPLVEARMRTLGLQDKDTQYGIAKLARARHRLDPSEASLTACTAALAEIERLAGPDHPNIFQYAGMLAAMHLESGNLDQALAHYRRAWQGLTRILGPDHLDRLEAGEGLARTLTRQGDRVQAAAILEDIVARERRTLRPAHPVLVRGIGAQAEVLRDLGETDRARQLYAEALEQVAVVDPLTRGDKVALLHGWAELERQAGNRTVENELRASARSVPALQDD
ncbi:MAG: serine/threonine protein kinase [bacterium]|nr:serine/threonine protein kinase [bacterium]